MSIDYVTGDDHVVTITINRPEGAIRSTWSTSSGCARPGSASARTTMPTSPSSPGSASLLRRADLKTYIPQITELQSKMKAGSVPRARRVPARRRREGGPAGQSSTSRSSRPSTGPVWPAAWRCSVAPTCAWPRHGHLRRDGAQARPLRRGRHHRAPAPPDPVSRGHGAPALRRPGTRPERLRDGPAQRGVPSGRPDGAGLDYAHRITANGPFAIRKTKESALRGLATDMKEAYRIESEISGEVFSSEDAGGAARLREKRAPNWKNR